MVNTRLYFDKDYTPPPKESLLLRIIGYSPVSDENDAFILTYPTGKSGEIWEFAGKPRHHIEEQSYTVDELLNNFSLLQSTSDQEELNNFSRIPKDGSYLTSYQEMTAFFPHNFKKLLNNQDIKYILRDIVITEVTNDLGVTVPLHPSFDPNNFLYLFMPDLTNIPEEGNSFSLEIPKIYVDANLNNYVYDTDDLAGTKIKYIKVKVSYTAGIEVTEEAKKHINPLDPDLIVKKRESTFYFLPATRGVFIDVHDGVTINYINNLDYVIYVGEANLSQQADGTWTLSYLLTFNNGASNIGYIIDNIPYDQVKPGNIIYTDTTQGTLVVPFIVASKFEYP